MSWATLNRAERRKAIVVAAAAGVSPAKLARQLGAAVTAITALAEREGIPFHEPKSPSNRGANAGGEAWQGGAPQGHRPSPAWETTGTIAGAGAEPAGHEGHVAKGAVSRPIAELPSGQRAAPASLPSELASSPYGWSKARVAWLERRVQEGASFSVIAEELGITRNAAIGKARRLGRREASPEPVRRAARPAREPNTYTAIRKPARGNANGGLAFKLAAGTAGRKPAAAIATPPRPQSDLPKPDSLGVTLLDVKDTQCKYPDGGMMDPAITFCGQPAWKRVVRGEERLGPWCEYHARLCYQPVGERSNRNLASAARYFGGM